MLDLLAVQVMLGTPSEALMKAPTKVLEIAHFQESVPALLTARGAEIRKSPAGQEGEVSSS